MKEADTKPEGKKPTLGRAVKSVILIAIGILVAFPLFSISYYTMVRTSTPEFCASCHEIKPAVRAWRQATSCGRRCVGTPLLHTTAQRHSSRGNPSRCW